MKYAPYFSAIILGLFMSFLTAHAQQRPEDRDCVPPGQWKHGPAAPSKSAQTPKVSSDDVCKGLSNYNKGYSCGSAGGLAENVCKGAEAAMRDNCDINDPESEYCKGLSQEVAGKSCHDSYGSDEQNTFCEALKEARESPTCELIWPPKK